MAHEDIVELNDSTFQAQAMSGAIPAVVDFWAPWCGPCRMLTPIFEELAGDYKGKVLFVKVNVDDSPRVASQFGVVSIPTVSFIKGGKVADQHVGLLAKAPLKAKVDALLK